MKNSFIYRTLPLVLTFSSLEAFAQSKSVISSDELFPPGISRVLKNFDSSFSYINDYQNSRNKNGRTDANIGALEAYLSSDFSKWTPVDGSFNAHYVHIAGTNPMEKVEDVQGTSNIGVPQGVDRMGDLWYQQNIGEKNQLLLGIHDISTEFNITNSSLNFTNSSFGTGAEISYAGVHGPSVYPITSLGMRHLVNFNDNVSLRTGLYDGDPGDTNTYKSFSYKLNRDEGAYLISELAYENSARKTGLGAWTYSKKQPNLENEELTGRSGGAFLIHEENINDKISVFGRYGMANQKVAMIANNLAFGSVYRGIFQKDTADEIGLGYTRAQFSKQYLNSLTAPAEAPEDEEALVEEEAAPTPTYKKAEQAMELYYQCKPMKQLLLRPDLQYVLNPAGSTEINDAFVMAMRVQINL